MMNGLSEHIIVEKEDLSEDLTNENLKMNELGWVRNENDES